MYKGFKHMAPVRWASLAAVCASLLLSGCVYDDPVFEDSYKPANVSDRYPIRVEKAPVKVGLRTPSGTLSAEQMDAVRNFASDARRTASSRISVRWPSGSGASRQAAQAVGQALVDEGLPSSMIALGSYPGGSQEPIKLSFERKVAVTKECGDWSDNLASSSSNQPYRNFGCATQQNIAAMVANPEDFEQPRAMSPVLAGNRMQVMKIFVENGTAGNFFTLKGQSGGGG